MVTMKWWDEIWLNESFAQLISFLAYSHLFENKGTPQEIPSLQVEPSSDAWLSFAKWVCSAYLDDIKPTSHPIQAVCEFID
jgi:aminopeptidase N